MMTVKEFFTKLEDLMTKSGHKAEDYFNVVIETSEPRMAPPAVMHVKDIYIGADHHKYELLIVPDRELIPQKCDRDNYRKPIIHCETHTRAERVHCPNCQMEIGTPKFYPNYCPHCGQQVKQDNEILWKK